MGTPLTSYTSPIDHEQSARLKSLLEARGYEFAEKPYSLFSAKKERLHVTVYEKGPKVLVQGKATEDFVKFVLEPEILKAAFLGYEEETNPEMFEPHLGIDESGKGDFFGPLVIAGTYTNSQSARALLDGGIADSKRITSDSKIRKLSALVRKTPDIVYEVMVLRPQKYNELYARFANLNKLLAWGHATVIDNLHRRQPDCPRALSDQFANPRELRHALKQKKCAIQLQQKTKAESDIAVAAASILAREKFIDWMDETSAEYGLTIPRGASQKVKDVGRNLVETLGPDILEKLAKTHFKTGREILNGDHPTEKPI